MKNKDICKDKWYTTIGLEAKYFTNNFIEYTADGNHHRDHLLMQSHINNFGSNFNIAHKYINGRGQKLIKFNSTDQFGYLPNYNRYHISNLPGDIELYDYVDKKIINDVEKEIALVTIGTKKVLSQQSIDCLLKMFVIQQTFRNYNFNLDLNEKINAAYDLTFPKYFDLMIEQHLYNKNNNPYNLPIMTDDEFLQSADFSKKKNYLKIGFLKKAYDGFLMALINYKYAYLLSFDDVFLTSDSYGCKIGDAIYIPISANKIVIISKLPYKTSDFQYEWIPSINRILWDQAGLFCVWGQHYTLPICTATMQYIFPEY